MRHRRSPVDSMEAVSQDLFRARLDQIIDRRHPLAVLAARMPWAAIESELSEVLPPAPTGAGRAALPLRLMVGLLYLKHAFDASDEEVCTRWLENPYWQVFTGEVYFQTTSPCDPSSLTRGG
jgi:transposase, IS5 family